MWIGFVICLCLSQSWPWDFLVPEISSWCLTAGWALSPTLNALTHDPLCPWLIPQSPWSRSLHPLTQWLHKVLCRVEGSWLSRLLCLLEIAWWLSSYICLGASALWESAQIRMIWRDLKEDYWSQLKVILSVSLSMTGRGRFWPLG